MTVVKNRFLHVERSADDHALVPVEQRRFGPHFEKPCRNPDNIICAARSCQVAYECRFRMWKGKSSS